MGVIVLVNEGTRGKINRSFPTDGESTSPSGIPKSDNTRDPQGLLGFLSRSKGVLVDRWLNLIPLSRPQDVSKLERLVHESPKENLIHRNVPFQPSINSRIREAAR